MSNSFPPTSEVAWLSYGEAADQLGIDVIELKQLLRDGVLLSTKVNGNVRVPAELIVDGQISKYLRGVINVLRDGGFDDDEAITWLVTHDETLGGTPAWALHHHLHREVSRRAQALAF